MEEEVPTSATGRRADRKAIHLKRRNGTNIQTKPWSITVSRAFLSRLSTTMKALNLTNWASKKVSLIYFYFFDFLKICFPKDSLVQQQIGKQQLDSFHFFRWRFWEIGRRRRARMVQRSQRRSSGSLPGQLRRNCRLNENTQGKTFNAEYIYTL